jgi:valyl-tRNA synthetase
LSRQLWWGHQIPAYFVKIEGSTGDRSEDELWITGRTEEEARTKAEKKWPGKTFTLERDEDVLDTWFSSGLWPFSTLGWPKNTADFEKLFPTSVLETGWDILFFWVRHVLRTACEPNTNFAHHPLGGSHDLPVSLLDGQGSI